MSENQILKQERNNKSQDSENHPSKDSHISKRKLMLFDLSIKGHHPSYIQHLIKYWQKQHFNGHLDIVVSPAFFKEHSDVVELQNGNVSFTAISSEEEAILSSRKSKIKRNLRNFYEWKIFCNYAQLLNTTHALLMYFDTCGLPLALGANSPCPFSGIYFRPTFHYNQFDGYQPSWKDQVQQLREKFILSRITRNPQLQTLLSLDPFAVEHLNKFNSQAQAVHLPDPVEEIPYNDEITSSSIKEDLAIEPGRQVFFLFGAITARKGIYQLLEALNLLPDELCQKLCLLIVGESGIKAELEKIIGDISQTKPVQIISRYEFIPDQEMQAYCQMVDVILAPYQRHVGMSGILLLAAAAGKPVLSSNYGLMGQMVRRYSLGLAVDSTVPEEIASGLSRMLVASKEELCDRTLAQSFAEENSAEKVCSNNL